jgi:radical SAM/Cys-rich protein
LADAVNGKVITRTNLAILFEDGFDDLAGLWADLGVEVAFSLPSWEEHSTDYQRGEGVFKKVVKGLRQLNAVGYGHEELSPSGKTLIANLVMNPGGGFLPPSQSSAEYEFRKNLKDNHGVAFNRLLTITNNPTGRFRSFLEERGTYDTYMNRLASSFNDKAIENMMCRSQISVSWDGRLFDCDFNQALDWPLIEQATILELVEQGVLPRKMRLAEHCYACTAGAGSSCGGATTPSCCETAAPSCCETAG